MIYLPLTELIDYMNEHVPSSQELVVEIKGFDDTYGDNPCQRLDFDSKHQFTDYVLDLAGSISIMELRELQARIV